MMVVSAEPFARPSKHPTAFPPWPIEDSLGQPLVIHAARRGDRPAVIDPGGVTTYAELEAWSRRIALALRALAGHPVGVMVEHGVAQIAAILGVLRAGAIYVPLDAALPVPRLRTIIGDAGLTTVVSDRLNRSLAQWLVASGDVLEVGRAGEPVGEGRVAEVDAGAPAYIYYTSGSTGPAKGVVDSHRNVMHNIARYTHALDIGYDDRLTLVQSCGFSGAVSNIFGALLNGAVLLPFDVRRHGVSALARWLATVEPTIYHSVPSLFRQLVDTGVALPTLRVIRIEGDLGGADDVERFHRHFNRPGQARCVLAHGLGATETGLVAQHIVTRDMPPRPGAMPVGHVLPDVAITIADAEGRPLPPGQIGEVAVTSRYLATGYWKRPDLTAARFTLAADGLRCYRSGDLGRIDGDGALELHGRADLLVRIHGEWIDLQGLGPHAGNAAGDGPITPTERVVAEVFARTLGVSHVGRDDDFFELGGDSLRAVEASMALQERLGSGLALGAFQHASSVRGLAGLLDGAEPPDDLVVLQPDGAATPLVVVHGHGGNVFSLRALARWFGPERPVFGLQLRGFGGVGRPPLSIEDAAASHVQHLRRVQPRGPYQLAGNCFGSWVAIEMARQLVAAGEHVAALLLINPDLPATRMTTGLRRRVSERALWTAWQLGLLRRGPLAALTQRPSLAVMVMRRRYRPAPCPAAATLLLPSDRLLDAASRAAWRGLLAGGCEVVNIVGTSTDLFWNPQARELGACIAARLVP